jgi:hypothetical protein
VNTERSCFEKLVAFENTVKHLLKLSPAINLDKTGLRINAARNWLHVAGTDELTYYFAHQKRGSTAMDAIGILPNYTGVAHTINRRYVSTVNKNSAYVIDAICAIFEGNSFVPMLQN